MKDAEAAIFSGATIDRAAHLRADPDALAELSGRNDALHLALWRNKPLFEDPDDALSLAWLSPGSPLIAGKAAENALFLGMLDGTPRFAHAIPDWPGAIDTGTGFVDTTRQTHPALGGRFHFAELRAVMGRLKHDDAGNAATARGLFAWHETHGFCARCGARSKITLGGWRRECGACGTHHFPRTDPVVIMLITFGNSVLLGRSPGWPEGMYSLLAGFMEPGETIEAAVRRETWEETRIPVGPVSYLASQPWPFPSSLMIGCHGEALSREIVVDPAEIEKAIWLSREDLLDLIGGHNPGMFAARRGSIARFLLERWLADRLD